jgi:acyl-CoA reductase-like NAD-dependent aldehyde dehydrogenase
MMKRRLEALARIGKLQKQLHELAAWRLAQIGRRRDGLAEDERGMWRAMGEGVTAYGPPAEAGMRRIRQIEAEIAAAEAAYAAQSRRAFREGARAKLAERAHDGLEAKYRDQKQRKELAELIERSLGKPPSSSA